MPVAWVLEKFVFLMSEEERFDMSNRSGKRGPNTPEGKLASSKNSKKHGLTSKKLHDPAEMQLILQHEKEITDYYQPVSPFAKILSHQIASYVVKSKRLKEIEALELQQKVYELENNPHLILDSMKHVKGTEKGMLLELILFKEIKLPCGLTNEILRDIVTEIHQFYGVIQSEDDVFKAFPKLVTFLNAQSYFKEHELMSIDEKLRIISDRIQSALNEGDKYAQYFRSIFDRAQKPDVPEEMTEHEAQVMEYVRQNQEQRNEKYARHRDVKPVQKKFAPHATFIGMLQRFNELFIALCLALKAKKAYDQMKDFMIKSVALSAERSDLLMRYQTTADRGLSRLIGEYMIVDDRDKVGVPS